MKTCWICAKPLVGSNRTGEHIIPGAIGGKKEVFEFICRKCNSEFGAKWEAEVAKQLLWFSSAAGVKRAHGGNHPDIKLTTLNGEKLKLQHDSVFVKDGHETSVSISDNKLQAKITSEDIKYINNIAKKIAKENPDFNFKDATTRIERVNSYLDEEIELLTNFGGDLVWKSIIKSIISLFSESNLDRNLCSPALNHLLYDKGCVLLNAYTADIVENRPRNHIFHCISIIAQRNGGRILGYAEYFNFARALIHIGDGYEGDDLQLTYAINPVTGKEIDISVNFNLIKTPFILLKKIPIHPPQAYIESHTAALNLTKLLQSKRVRRRAFFEARIETNIAFGLKNLTKKIPEELRTKWKTTFREKIQLYTISQNRD